MMMAPLAHRGCWTACGEILRLRKGFSETCLQRQHIHNSHSVFSDVLFAQIASACKSYWS